MKKLIFCLAILLPALCLARVPQTVKTHDGQTLKLVWNDEFKGTGLPDPAKWGYEHGFVRNGEAQFYTRGREKNVYQKNGKLIIKSFREDY